MQLTIQNNINECAREYAVRLRQKVSVPYPPASSPGQPPRRRTGTGASSIRVDPPATYRQLTDFTQNVWFDQSGFYMRILDQGLNPRIAPRPFVERAGLEMEPHFRKTLLR